jgi:hypothetical protein
MRKNLTPDADATGRPTPVHAAAPGGPGTPVEPAESAVPPTEDRDSTAPSLVWPPVEDELNEWEVLHVQSTGHTILEPMKFAPPATPAPYMPPAAVDDPVGDASLLPPSDDFDLPETELIEPLSLEPTLAGRPAMSPAPPPSAAPPPDDAPFATDDRTIVLPRPASLSGRPERPAAAVVPPAPSSPSSEDTNPGVSTRVLVSPNFAATVGHAPTVPVSALHRAARPQPAFGPRRQMEKTLPAGVPREQLLGGHSAVEGDRSDETAVPWRRHDETHPPPSPIDRRPAVGPAGPPSPFSRVPSRGPQPLVEPAPSGADPAPFSVAPPPLAFGPRVMTSPLPPSPSPSLPSASSSSPSSSGSGLSPSSLLGLSASSSGSFPASPAASPPARPPSAPPATASAAERDDLPTRPASSRARLLSVVAAVAVVLLLALGAYQMLAMRSTSAAAPANATLSVESSPAGATVSIDGTPRGTTPVRLELGEGGHALEVSLAGATRRVPLTLAAGTITAHSFEFASPTAPVEADSAIEVRSEPAGARVLVDGTPRGVTPIVVTGLTAGRHEVQVAGPFRAVTKSVTLAPKKQTLVVITPATQPSTTEPGVARPARVSADTGFIAIQSPIVLRIVRNGDFVGTSEDARLSLPVGSQVIGLENESVGFRDVRTVDVVAGKVTPVAVVLPKGEISINARPWAEVFVDGNRVGETPVSQLSLPIGIHEIVFRHPEHGERRVSVVVKIGATGRAFTDFTK